MTECWRNGLTNILLHDIQPPLNLSSVKTAGAYDMIFSGLDYTNLRPIVTSRGPAPPPVLQTGKQKLKKIGTSNQ